MVSNGSVKVLSTGVRYELEGELCQLVDSIGCKNRQLGFPCSRPVLIVPSLGSATARDTFFSSLIESSKLDSRGVTLPSTRAAVCSRAVAALSNLWKSFNLRLPGNDNAISTGLYIFSDGSNLRTGCKCPLQSHLQLQSPLGLVFSNFLLSKVRIPLEFL